MNKNQFIDKLTAKDEVVTSFLVKYIAVAEGKDGKSYLNIVLCDRTGEIEARKWHGAEQVINHIKAGDLVIVNGKMNQFQGRLQLIILEISKLTDDQIAKINREDFVQKAAEAPEKMYTELLKIVTSLDEMYIKELLLLILNDYEISRRLKIWQAGKSIHHAYQSGLLEHILSCTQLALKLSPHYKVNTSYVVAGCILHDLCKIYELTEGPVVEYTEEGKLVGHLVKGLEIVDQFSYKIKDFPYSVKLHIKHILLAHHGEYEYGSPKIPHTSEAFLVHMIDYMDSKMNSFEQVKSNDSNNGAWSGYVKHLDRMVFKDSLPSFKNEKNEKNENAEKVHRPEIKTSMSGLLKDFKLKGN